MPRPCELYRLARCSAVDAMLQALLDMARLLARSSNLQPFSATPAAVALGPLARHHSGPEDPTTELEQPLTLMSLEPDLLASP